MFFRQEGKLVVNSDDMRQIRNTVKLQTMHFDSICDTVWEQVYLVTLCIGFTYLLYFKSNNLPVYDFYLEIQHIFRHICQKDVTMETFNL